MSETLLKNGNCVNFTLYNVKTFNPSKFKAVKIIAVINYRAVASFGVDAHNLYYNCVPYIPNGTSMRVEDWEFIVIETTGGRQVIPIPAIQPDSITLAAPSKCIFTVNDVNQEDIQRILFAIESLGYSEISVRSE